ncbi:MAG TPA: hypothetical protein VJQ77_05780 [Novosphingobium sp.]|nr:hypothetical protein [Novosphingobium sp.]
MTLTLPEENLPSNLLAPPFLMPLRVFEVVRDAQLEWWRAWCGLLGQVAPLPAEEIIDKLESDGG